MRSPLRDVEASFFMRLFNIPTSVGTRPRTKKELLSRQSFLQGLEDHLCVFDTYV